MSCGIGHRCGSDLALLWLWLRPAAAAPFQPLAWELSYAAGMAFKKKKKDKKIKINLSFWNNFTFTKLFVLVFATPLACGSSQARDRTRTTAVTTPDP